MILYHSSAVDFQSLAGGSVGPRQLENQLPPDLDVDRRPLLIGVTSIFFAIAFLIVILRLTVRWKQGLPFRSEDYLITIALVSLLRSLNGAELIPFRFCILVFGQRYCSGGPMLDVDVSD